MRTAHAAPFVVRAEPSNLTVVVSVTNKSKAQGSGLSRGSSTGPRQIQVGFRLFFMPGVLERVLRKVEGAGHGAWEDTQWLQVPVIFSHPPQQDCTPLPEAAPSLLGRKLGAEFSPGCMFLGLTLDVRKQSHGAAIISPSNAALGLLK